MSTQFTSRKRNKNKVGQTPGVPKRRIQIFKEDSNQENSPISSQENFQYAQTPAPEPFHGVQNIGERQEQPIYTNLKPQVPENSQNYQNLQRDDQKQQIMQLEKQLAEKKEKYRRMQEVHKKRIEDLIQQNNEQDSEISKLKNIISNGNGPSLEEQNKQLESQIQDIINEKSKQEELQKQYAIQIEKLKSQQKDLEITIRALPQYNKIEELKKLMARVERETNQKVAETEKETRDLSDEIAKMKEDIDALNLDGEDLHQQNIELYNQKQELQKQYSELITDTTTLKFSISQQKALVTLDYFNQQVEEAKKKNQKNIEKFRKKANEIIIKAQNENKAIQQEIYDQERVIRDLTMKVKERRAQYEKEKIKYAAKLDKDRNDYSQQMQEFSYD